MSDITIPSFDLQLDGDTGVTYDMDLTSGSGITVDLGDAAMSGGTTDHTRLTNRNVADQHPISAITGLQDALDDIQESFDEIEEAGYATEIWVRGNAPSIVGISNYPTKLEVQTDLAGFTPLATFEDLSDYVDELAEEIGEPGEMNVIDSISVNGVDVPPDQDKNVDLTVPTYSTATTESDGLMSSSDKVKLNGIDADAEANQNAFSTIGWGGDNPIYASDPEDSLIIVPGTGINLSNVNDQLAISITETDPTVPAWAKAANKPTYTPAEIGAVPTTRTVNGLALSSDISLAASDVGAMPLSGGTMTGPITLLSNQYIGSGEYGLDCNNSDLINFNSLWGHDVSGSADEGFNFYRDGTIWDGLYAKNGVLYFSPGRSTGGDTSKDQEVLHLGNAYTYAPTYRTNPGDLSWTGIRAFGHVTTSSKSLEIFFPWAKAIAGTWTAKEMSVVVRSIDGYPSARSGSSGGTYTALGASYADILDNGASKRANEVDSITVVAHQASGFLITINFHYALTKGSTTTAITNNTPVSVTLSMTLTRA